MLFLLRFLDLSNNKDLIGNIPTNIENLSRLKNLYLYNMQLTSTIPNSIGKLTELLFMQIYGTKLSGGIGVFFLNI